MFITDHTTLITDRFITDHLHNRQWTLIQTTFVMDPFRTDHN